MGTRDDRIDAYIAQARDFAKPMLRELRELVHEGCPEVHETIKWGMPSFEYKGILCGMAAFKAHCAFYFWKGSLILDKSHKSAEAMGQFGRIVSIEDLPPRRELIGYVKEAKRLNDEGVKAPPRSRPKTDKKNLTVPDYFTAALKKNKKALTTFEAFPYSKRKDYIEWVAEARTGPTRERRVKTSVEWLAAGKSRNWKYEKC